MNKLPFHIIFFVIFPILSLYDHNKDMLEFQFILRSLIMAISCVIATFAASYILLRNSVKAGLYTSAIVLLFFLLGHILKYNYAPSLVSPGRYHIVGKLCYLFVIIALAIAIFVFKALFKTKNNLHSLNQYLNIVSFLLITFLSINIGLYQIKIQKVNKQIYAPKIENVNDLPDVYYIILDGYARNDILKDLYNFNNENFLHKLEELGFYVAKSSTSNYARTYYSLSSSLNFSYLDPTKLRGTATKVTSLKEMIKNNQLITSFRSQGYTIITTPTSWSGIEGNIRTDIAFNGMLFNDFERMLITLTPLQLFFNSKFLAEEHRQAILSGFKALVTVPEIEKPTFTISHIYSPHPPFVFDENGDAISSISGFSKQDGVTFFEGNPNNPDVEDYRREYSSQLKFISKLTLKTIDRILVTSSKPPVIVLQSDHGPGSELFFRDPEKTNIKERMSILNAYYLPEKGKEQLYESITPVNSFRVILNYLFDANLELLRDKNYFIGKLNMYDFIDVTDRVK